MKSVVLIAGHSNVRGKDNGAVYDGHLEGVLAVELRRSIFQEYNKLMSITIFKIPLRTVKCITYAKVPSYLWLSVKY